MEDRAPAECRFHERVLAPLSGISPPLGAMRGHGGWGLMVTLLRDRTRLSTGSWSNSCSSSIR